MVPNQETRTIHHSFQGHYNPSLSPLSSFWSWELLATGKLRPFWVANGPTRFVQTCLIHLIRSEFAGTQMRKRRDYNLAEGKDVAAALLDCGFEVAQMH